MTHQSPIVDIGTGVEPSEEQAPRLGFFQQPWVQNILPFVTSLSVHAVIIVLGIAAARIIIANVPTLLNQEQTIIPEAQLVEAGPPGGLLNPGLDNKPFAKVMNNETPENTKPDGVASKDGPAVNLETAGGSEGDAQTSPLAIGLNGIMGGRSAGGPGTGGDASGPLAQFGPGSGGGGIGPHGIVFGHGGNARQIIFVCDASGSMLTKMATLKSELQKAVEGLKPFQSFNIIFFQNSSCVALDKNAMVPATSDNKRKAYAFLDDVTTTGVTEPNPGLTMAFSQHPELVYLLTDGDFPDNNAVKAKIRDLNRDHKTKINTIAFVGNTDAEVDFLKLLEEVAKESGGHFKRVSESEVAQ